MVKALRNKFVYFLEAWLDEILEGFKHVKTSVGTKKNLRKSQEKWNSLWIISQSGWKKVLNVNHILLAGFLCQKYSQELCDFILGPNLDAGEMVVGTVCVLNTARLSSI